jgi:hypothetical protein
MRVKPIVEGHGEVKAVPELIRRLASAGEIYSIEVLSSIRAHRTDFINPDKLAKWLQLARLDGPDAILILFDADDDCPLELVHEMEAKAKTEASPIPLEIVIANREYEAWFLAAIESLRGVRGIGPDAEYSGEPEEPRDTKRRLTQRMIGERSYSETADQAALTSIFDLAMAYRRCRSFRRAATAMGRLFHATGQDVEAWPPSEWLSV